MKRIWQHPEPIKTGRRYWRSLDERENTPEFQERLGREFDPTISDISQKDGDNSRRDFMKLMGGAAALSGLALVSCRRPVQKVLPFTKHVEWIIPGKPLLYATSMPRPWGASPMVVTTHEGRPTHLQGNQLHPQGGGIDIFAQGSILDLYNPDRVKGLTRRPKLGEFFERENEDGTKKKIGNEGKEATWDLFQSELRGWGEQWAGNGGAGLAVLVSESSSPTQARLLADLVKKYPKAKAYSYEAYSNHNFAAASKALVGDSVRLVPNFKKADRVFSLDCDFLGNDWQSEDGVRDFMKRRAPEKKGEVMNRLYVLENRYTLTGGVSDHRKPLAASLIPAAAAALAEEIGKLAGDAALASAAASLAAGVPANIRAWIAIAAKDLAANKGKSLVLAGFGYSEAVQALVLGINNALGAVGTTLDAIKADANVCRSLAELEADLKAKSLKQLFILTEGDPAYDVPGFKQVLQTAGETTVVSTLAMRDTLTARYSHWTLPAAHYLEAWGDARSSDGTYAIVQPMIQPLFGGASVIDALLALLSEKNLDPSKQGATEPGAPAPEDPSYNAVRATFTAQAGGLDEEKWNVTLRDGFLAKSAAAKATATVNAAAIAGLVAKAKSAAAPSPEAMEVVITPDSTLWDGRYAENSWLQEAPDPVTKLTWDNAAWVSPRTFRETLKLSKDGDMIDVVVGDRKLTLPAIQCPGHAHNSITISLGYGQTFTNIVGKGRGVDANTLRGNRDEFVLAGAKVSSAGKNYELAITQDIYTMEARAQVREGTQERFDENETFAQTEGMDSHIPPSLALYQGRIGQKNDPNKPDYFPNGFDYENDHQWGMVIDLSKCIGCTACIVACQSENNIPVVGKDQVIRGRVMQWIRMDRYFATPDDVDRDPTLEELDNPEMIHQPVACQQCESAPCETVCPVNATVHTEEGLNAMAYNRCIGTRYCANNCPYGARRFNYFDFNKRNPLVEKKLPIFSSITGEDRNLYAGPLGELKPQEVNQLQKNPNVTVRMRGVIEKCTYCVQRLEAAKINQRRVAKDDPSKLRVAPDAVKTACQASCPAEAIMFGDLASEKSTINKWKASPRNYQVLKYLGVRPRTSYLARIRNVNPEMAPVETDRVVKTGEASLHNI